MNKDTKQALLDTFDKEYREQFPQLSDLPEDIELAEKLQGRLVTNMAWIKSFLSSAYDTIERATVEKCMDKIDKDFGLSTASQENIDLFKNLSRNQALIIDDVSNQSITQIILETKDTIAKSLLSLKEDT